MCLSSTLFPLFLFFLSFFSFFFFLSFQGTGKRSNNRSDSGAGHQRSIQSKRDLSSTLKSSAGIMPGSVDQRSKASGSGVRKSMMSSVPNSSANSSKKAAEDTKLPRAASASRFSGTIKSGSRSARSLATPEKENRRQLLPHRAASASHTAGFITMKKKKEQKQQSTLSC